MAYTTIKKPSDYFNTKLYTGNGGTQSITGVGFQPDFIWIKQRNGTAYHNAYDAVRGFYRLRPNDTGASSARPYAITSFDSDGFSLGNDDDVNGNSNTTVAWNWKANGAGSANTAGSINSTVSASATSGFSVVSWTGTGANATVGHGLSSAPKMIIIKRLDSADQWIVYHNSLGNTGGVYLNLTNSVVDNDTWFNDTSPTSTVFSIGSNSKVNASSATYIAYCFADVQGYSKFGSYTGNGNADGTFVYTGQKSAFIMIKNISSASTNWHIYDNKRLGYNVDNNVLRPNLSDAELTNDDLDILSNGFKLRRVTDALATNGDTYIYMAFAEQPLVGDNPATAR